MPRLRRQRPGRPALHARPVDGRGQARAGRAAGRRHAAPLRRRAAQGRAHPAARVPHRRRPRRQRGARARSRVLKSSIPFVSRVENRRPARGGVDGEDIEKAKVRGPILLRTRSRAVTTEDYEQLAREAAPEVARVRAVAAGDGADAGSVRVLIVPSAVAEQRPAPLRAARAQPGHAPEDHRPPRGEPRHRHARDRRAARLPRDHGRRQAAGALAGQPDAPPGGRAARAVRVLPPDHRRSRRHRLAVRPAGQRGRGLLRAPGHPRARSSSRTPGCSAPTR